MGFNPSRADRLGESGIVAFVFVGIFFGKFRNGCVKSLAGTQVTAYGSGVAGASVYSGPASSRRRGRSLNGGDKMTKKAFEIVVILIEREPGNRAGVLVGPDGGQDRFAIACGAERRVSLR